MEEALTVPEIITERYLLRAICREDAAFFWPAFSDEAQMRYWSRGPFDNLDELADWLLDTGWGGRSWVAQPLGGGDPLCRIIARADAPQISEIGYLTIPGHQRQGIALECVAALVEHLFGREDHHRIWADVDPENHASNRLLETLGFTREAQLRDAMKTHIGWRDSYIWGLLASDRSS